MAAAPPSSRRPRSRSQASGGDRNMDMGRLLEGRRVPVVGGGGAGNGRGITRGVGSAGARVAVVDINPDRAQEAAQDGKDAGGDAPPLVGDVRAPAEVDRLMS